MANPVNNQSAQDVTHFTSLPQSLNTNPQTFKSNVPNTALPILEQNSLSSNPNQKPLSPNQPSTLSNQHRINHLLIHSSKRRSAITSSSQKNSRLNKPLTYVKIAFAAYAIPDIINVAETIIEQPTFSRACIASVTTMAHSNIALKIGGIIVLTPSIFKRIVYGSPWEQAATLAAGATAYYCSGGALMPTLLFAESAGLCAKGAEETKNTISNSIKKAKMVYTKCISHITCWHRPSIRQTFHNLSACLRKRREK